MKEQIRLRNFQKVSVERVFIHPEYKKGQGRENNIAVILVKTIISLNYRHAKDNFTES